MQWYGVNVMLEYVVNMQSDIVIYYVMINCEWYAMLGCELFGCPVPQTTWQHYQSIDKVVQCNKG